MSRETRPRVRATFRIGPWFPGWALPALVGLLGLAGSLLVLQGPLLLGGAVLSVISAVRVRTAAPWLLVALLAVGQVLQQPEELGAGLPALVLVVHLLVVLTGLARAVPSRSRVQAAALGPTAVTTGLVQVVAQALAALLLATQGRLAAVPTATAVGGALLVVLGGALVLTRRHEER